VEPHAGLVERYYDFIRHVHVNEMDGRHPGTGSYDFKPVLGVLRRRASGVMRQLGWLAGHRSWEADFRVLIRFDDPWLRDSVTASTSGTSSVRL